MGHLKTTLNWRVSYDLASHFQCLISPLISDQSCKWEFSARVIIICQHHFIQSIRSAVAIPNTFVLPIIKPPPQWNRLKDDDEISVNHQLQSLPFSPQTSFLMVASSNDDLHLFEQIFHLSTWAVHSTSTYQLSKSCEECTSQKMKKYVCTYMHIHLGLGEKSDFKIKTAPLRFGQEI